MRLLLSPNSGLTGDMPLERCVEGDEVAWRILVNRYQSTVRVFLRRLGVREQSLDDSTQDVFLELFRYLPKFRGESSFKTWLYRICLTQARKETRRRRVKDMVRNLLALEWPEEADHSPLEASAASRSLEVALARLSESERSVFVLYELEGIEGRDIAEMLDCPESTVFRRLHYARKKFESVVREEYPS